MNFLSLITSYPINRWIIWVGAGISSREPTLLPLGLSLTDFALQECCGDAVQNRIRLLWDEANKIIATDRNGAPLGVRPRLESILGDIDEVGRQAINSEFDFLRGFKAFTTAPFNENHLYVAELLRQGATILTTNFDTCIEAAYKYLSQGSDELEVRQESGGLLCHSQKSATQGRLWHVHGTAENTATLGATIRAVKEGLSAGLQDWFHSTFKEPCALIFFGYSASDSFDVNLYFANKAEGRFADSLGIFIQHAGYEVPMNASVLVRPFGRRLIATEDTTDALMILAEGQVESETSSKFSWKDAFLKNAILTDRSRVRDYLVCKIAFTLGVNVDFLDQQVYTKALKSERYFDELDFNKTLAYVCRVQGKSELEKRHDLKVKRTDDDLLGYYYSKGDLRRAINYAKPISELFKDASRPGVELDWRTYTSMSAHCRTFVEKYLRRPFIARVEEEDRQQIEELLKLTDLLGNVPLRNVRFINQVATALRFSFLFRALIHGSNEEEIVERVLYLYGEGASVAGFISTYRDMAIKEYFLTKYHNRGSLSAAIAHVKRSLALATLVGDNPSIKRAKKLSAYFNIYSSIHQAIKNSCLTV